ncbi:MAG: double-strand break repair helicase AddA [Sphingomonadales bacterium]|nr:double-strand break repair helicase AddA [Sphingomonadales bacterium]
MKTSLVSAHAPLKGEQRLASDPGEHVWLSASAGTGKTYVLSARVLRLLLRGARPDSILCLTFTKAGAAEMAERVHQRLAWWVRLDDTVLFRELEALGEPSGPVERENARTLFAKVLESRGGGLRIMTIHAFCQTLLAGFPLEAGLIPGFRPIEGREEAALGQSVLADVVVTAEREGDRRLLGDLSALSRRLGEDEARRFLSRAARAGEALDALPEGLDALVRRAMDVPADFDAGDIALACSDGAFDRPALLELARMYAGWATKTGEAAADRIAEWLLGSPEQRAAELSGLALVWLNKDGEFRKAGPKDPGFPALREQLNVWCGELCGLAARAELAAGVSSALNAGRRYARAYDGAKRARGLVDFDDLIRLTGRLLGEPGISDWIRYKLDQATDHILVDEAQDTNLRQWEIVAGLASEFFAGEGARDNFERTIFTVGDFKQAIYGFQGTDPEHYRVAGIGFNRQAEAAGREIIQLSLNASFRSSQPVLNVVDKLLDELGHQALGLPGASEPHVSFGGGFGQVTLLQPLSGDSAAEDDGEEGWVEDHVRKLAGTLAKQVRGWLSVASAERVWLERKARWLRPEDVMILVRKRGELAALLVARLQAEGVPVAGVDRLRLQAPLAVKDLLAAMRFAVQRGDDLTLAALLVSPLMGWDQDQLFAVAHGRKGSLWEAVPEGETREALLAILNAADRVTPFQFLETLLSGPLQGRRKLIARLGEEARDPIDELLNAALQFGREGTASLQGFLDWFDRGEGEIVRDAMGAGDAVRVMTVHGAKGLQAPVVVLADAAGDPDASGARGFEWVLDSFDASDGTIRPVPLFRPRAAERALVASLEKAASEADDRDRREHWRLLYVAMTRAEERLVVAGSLGTRAKGVVPPESWHAAIGRALARLEVVGVADPVWGSRADYVVGALGARVEEGLSTAFEKRAVLPDWLRVAAPVEARPPRPLAPSSLGVDLVASPPGGVGKADAAERGRRLHGLFERLPGVAVTKRRAAGIAWLGDAELVDAALAVIDDPAFADVFAEGALAEAPIAGVVDGVVVSGVVDRLIVTDAAVTIVDFKTGRVPRDGGAVPVHHLRQMAAYAAVVAQIFPDREVGAALLYSAGPVLYRVSAGDLARWKPGFSVTIQNLGVAG